MRDFDRESLCERLQRYFDQNPEYVKHAAHDITMVARKVDDQTFVGPLTWGEIVDAIVPMLTGTEGKDTESLGQMPARKRWSDLIMSVEQVMVDETGARTEAFRDFLRETELLEFALTRLIKECQGSIREPEWTVDDELAYISRRVL